MVPSFEFFDVASSRRAYFSAADQERAGYLAEITHAAAAESARYPNVLEVTGERSAPCIVAVGMS